MTDRDCCSPQGCRCVCGHAQGFHLGGVCAACLCAPVTPRGYCEGFIAVPLTDEYDRTRDQDAEFWANGGF